MYFPCHASSDSYFSKINHCSLPLSNLRLHKKTTCKTPSFFLFPKQTNLPHYQEKLLAQFKKPTKSISFKIKIKTMSASSSRAHKLTMLGYPGTEYEFRIMEQIGGGAHAKTHRAIREINSDHFAIKVISLDHYSEADSDAVRRETRAMILHSHPNLLASHCSFDVDDHNLWLVMPYMAAGSLQSIVSYAFSDGLPENCIAVVLKETLKGLSYLHHQCHLHTDIKAGDILLDHKDNELRSIKLEGSVMSVTIYNSSFEKSSSLSSSTRKRLTDVAGTPYWMAPEVVQDSDTGYSFKSDIWSFGITALELAHGGRPPFSHLPLSDSLKLKMKMKKRFGFYDHDYDYDCDEKRNEKLVKIFKSNPFSQEFKDMVASCLDQDPSRRPSADQLLEYPFFKNCHGVKFHSDVFFFTLPNVEERFKERKALHDGTPSQIAAGTETDSAGSAVKNRRISGWKFNESKLELEPGFYADADVKTVRFGGETIIDTDTNIGLSESPGGSGDLEGLVIDHAGANMSGIEGAVETSNPDTIELKDLVEIKGHAEGIIVRSRRGADVSQMVQKIENLMEELILEKENNFKLKMLLETINAVSSGVSTDAAAASAD